MPDGVLGVLIGIFIAPLVYLILLVLIWGIAEFIKERNKQRRRPFR